jgi:hypothetical protein
VCEALGLLSLGTWSLARSTSFLLPVLFLASSIANAPVHLVPCLSDPIRHTAAGDGVKVNLTLPVCKKPAFTPKLTVGLHLLATIHVAGALRKLLLCPLPPLCLFTLASLLQLGHRQLEPLMDIFSMEETYPEAQTLRNFGSDSRNSVCGRTTTRPCCWICCLHTALTQKAELGFYLLLLIRSSPSGIQSRIFRVALELVV